MVWHEMKASICCCLRAAGQPLERDFRAHFPAPCSGAVMATHQQYPVKQGTPFTGEKFETANTDCNAGSGGSRARAEAQQCCQAARPVRASKETPLSGALQKQLTVIPKRNPFTLHFASELKPCLPDSS